MKGNLNFVTSPNGTQFKAEIIGNVRLNNGIVLKNVLYVPRFYFNLISVSKLIKDLNCQVFFSANKFFIQESLMKSCLLLGKAQHGLYFLQEHSYKPFTEGNKDCAHLLDLHITTIKALVTKMQNFGISEWDIFLLNNCIFCSLV